jgi:hypothetical protein
VRGRIVIILAFIEDKSLLIHDERRKCSSSFVNPRKLSRINRGRFLLGLRADLCITAGLWRHGTVSAWTKTSSSGAIRKTEDGRIEALANCAWAELPRSYEGGFANSCCRSGMEGLPARRRNRLPVPNIRVEELFEFQPSARNAIMNAIIRIGYEVCLTRLQPF